MTLNIGNETKRMDAPMKKKQVLTVSLLILIVGVAVAADPGMTGGQKVPDAVSRMIEKSKSFGLERYPVSFWNYTNLKEHGTHMTEAEVESWADAGFTVPQSPGFDPTDPVQKAQHVCLLHRVCRVEAGALWHGETGVSP